MAHVSHDPSEVRQLAKEARGNGKSVGVVMTMGALHDGHLSLVRKAAQSCHWVVVTIFVNPTQFGPHEDYEAYPRTLERDLEQLGRCDVDVIFAPERHALFPDGHSTFVNPPKIAHPLEGRHRQGHFEGVCTVVLKLLNITGADRAYFGQKDFQQYLVVRDMVRELNLAAEIVACPIFRDPDGLAMSSRNRYLTDAERQSALAIPQSLQLAERLVSGGEREVNSIETAMRECLSAAQLSLDYASIVDVDTLQPLRKVEDKALAVIAAFAGKTRLIDNRLIHVIQ